MNYKKLIASRELRLKLLRCLDIIPDKYMIRIQYRIAVGIKLDLKNPKRFSQKLQWYKLHYRNPLMKQCVDKYEVREFVKSRGYDEILVPLYGVYNSVEEICFEDLPQKFVLKTTNGGGNNNVILCTDKSKLDLSHTKVRINNWLNKWSGKMGREWVYYELEPRIICEAYLDKDKNDDLIDYKFICFNGKVEFLFINSERESEKGLRFGIYNEKFEKLPYQRLGLRDTTNLIQRPINYEKMVEIAENLSQGFPHVRVDLYNVNGKIFFGEMTFFHGSGYVKFEPDEFDFILGEKFNIQS